MNLNLLLVPVGALALVALWMSGGGLAFWIATSCFWIYCLVFQAVERMGEQAPDAGVVIGMVTWATTALLGCYGVVRMLFG